MGIGGLQLRLLLGIRLELVKGVVDSAGGCLQLGCMEVVEGVVVAGAGWLEVGLVGPGLQLLGGLLILLRLALTARGLVVALVRACRSLVEDLMVRVVVWASLGVVWSPALLGRLVVGQGPW